MCEAQPTELKGSAEDHGHPGPSGDDLCWDTVQDLVFSAFDKVPLEILFRERGGLELQSS